ncbi:MAG: hypothetical protein ACPG4K_02065 [Haloferula sp.]
MTEGQKALLAFSIIAGFILVVLGYSIISGRREKAMKEKAQAMRFSFDGTENDADGPLLKSLNHLALFQHNDQFAQNIIRGRMLGATITIFDHVTAHRWRDRDGSNYTTDCHTVIVFQSDQLKLPFFKLRLKGAGRMSCEKWKEYVDVSFDNHRQFSKRYNLEGFDEAAIRQLFGDHVFQFFNQSGHWAVDGHEDTLVVGRMRPRRYVTMGEARDLRPRLRVVAVKDLQNFLDEGNKVFSLFANQASRPH